MVPLILIWNTMRVFLTVWSPPSHHPCTPHTFCWGGGGVAQFSNPWPYFRPNYVIFKYLFSTDLASKIHTNFQTWSLESHPASRAFLFLAQFWHSRERLCMNRVRSLLSMCCILPGYSFEPRPDVPKRHALAAIWGPPTYSISSKAFHKH